MTPHTHFDTFIPNGITARTDGALTMFPVSYDTLPAVLDAIEKSDTLTLKTVVALDLRAAQKTFRIMYVFGCTATHTFLVPYLDTLSHFPSRAHHAPRYAWYEREIATMYGLVPDGHPDPRPVMPHVSFSEDEFPLRTDAHIAKANSERDPLARYDFHTVQGEEVYEIPVGPVHAGIIEPGHFRFSVLGEEIQNLDPLLGWKHKGIEKLFETLPLDKKITLSERVSGDSSFAHSLAFCQALETIARITPPEEDRLLRVLYAELERIANHFSDIGYMMLDTAFAFGGAHGARLREQSVRWNERLSGSRFLRGINKVGGVTVRPARELLLELQNTVPGLRKDFDEVIAIASGSLSLQNRLRTTGTVTNEVAKAYGVLGVAGRATGSTADARRDFPYAEYARLNFTVATHATGDVYARFLVRTDEVRQSLALITQAIERLLHTTSVQPTLPLHFKKDSTAVSVVEGWRGDIVYVVATDEHGSINRVKVRDPSSILWQAFPHTVVGEVVPDFPLINKSFNLSYSGTDL